MVKLIAVFEGGRHGSGGEEGMLDMWPPAATLGGRSGDLGKIRAVRSSLQHGIPPPGGLHGLQEGVAGS